LVGLAGLVVAAIIGWFALGRPGIGQISPTATVPAAPARVAVIWLVRANPVEQKWENETVIPAFEAHNPTIQIRLEVAAQADYDARLTDLVSAGTPPDVWSLWGSASFQDYVKSGLVADLTPLIAADNLDLTDFIPHALETYRMDGDLMGLPFQTSGSFIFYNKDLFDKAGVAYPPTNWDDTSWTYAAFLDKCKSLTTLDASQETDVYGCNLDLSPNDALAWMFGKDLYPESAYLTGFADTAYADDALVVQAMQARQDLMFKYKYMPDPAVEAAFGPGSGDIFKDQKVAMNLTGPGGWQSYGSIRDFNWGVAALPYGDPGRKDVLFTDPWLLSAKTTHPQEAWAFYKYLVSPEVQLGWMKVTYAPPARQSLLAAWTKLFPSMTPAEVQEAFAGALKYGWESPSHLLVHYDQIDQLLSGDLAPVFNNQATVDETLPYTNQKLIDLLKQIKAQQVP
jgi:multiple sugar transport system substrate-binding protein